MDRSIGGGGVVTDVDFSVEGVEGFDIEFVGWFKELDTAAVRSGNVEGFEFE